MDGAPPTDAPGLGKPLLALALVLLGVVYGASALTTRDPVWFLPARLDEPAAVTVYAGGQARALEPGSPQFAAVAAALDGAVADAQAAARAGLSDETLRTLTQGPGSAVEVRFDRPQRLGGSHVRGRPTRLLVALDGPFAGDPYLFLGDERGWWAEALVSPGVAELRRALAGSASGPGAGTRTAGG